MKVDRKKYSLARYHARVKRFKSAGLNSRGKVYRRTPNLPAAGRAAHARKVTLAKYHRRAQRRLAAGLNSRGLSFVRADKTAAARLSLMLTHLRTGKSSIATLLKAA